MSDLKQSLTRCEQAMFKRLHDEKVIKWAHTCGSDTSTLNRLVKKGKATVHIDANDKWYRHWKCAHKEG